MKLLLFFGLMFLSYNCISQNTTKENSLSAEFGRNLHGTGDIGGFHYGLRYNRNFIKRFDLIIAFEGNLNDSEDTPFIWEDPNGNRYDSTLHNVIAGFHLNIGAGYNILNRNKHKFGVNPSILLRYQANSVPGDRIIDYPILTGFPVPIRYLIRNEPGRTHAIGYSIRFYYHYKLSDQYFIGISPGFQNDSNGDTILLTTLLLGINL